MGAAAYGAKGFKERAGVSGERPAVPSYRMLRGCAAGAPARRWAALRGVAHCMVVRCPRPRSTAGGNARWLP